MLIETLASRDVNKISIWFTNIKRYTIYIYSIHEYVYFTYPSRGSNSFISLFLRRLWLVKIYVINGIVCVCMCVYVCESEWIQHKGHFSILIAPENERTSKFCTAKKRWHYAISRSDVNFCFFFQTKPNIVWFPFSHGNLTGEMSN